MKATPEAIRAALAQLEALRAQLVALLDEPANDNADDPELRELVQHRAGRLRRKGGAR